MFLLDWDKLNIQTDEDDCFDSNKIAQLSQLVRTTTDQHNNIDESELSSVSHSTDSL